MAAHLFFFGRKVIDARPGETADDPTRRRTLCADGAKMAKRRIAKKKGKSVGAVVTAGAAPVPTARPNLRAQRREATRAAILQSALWVFSERGFSGASTRHIADHCKVHHALIKYYFGSKEALWRSAVNFLFERQATEIGGDGVDDKNMSTLDRRDFAKQMLRRYVRYCARHPEHARLMIQESVHDNPRLEWATKAHISDAARSAGHFVRMLQIEKILPDVSVPALVYIIAGGAQLFYTLAPEVRRIWGIDPTDPDVTEAHVEALLAVLMR